VIDFVNLKIKSAQSFEGAHRDMMCMRVFIGVNTHTYINICVCTMFFKKKYHLRYGYVLCEHTQPPVFSLERTTYEHLNFYYDHDGNSLE
jgi:hypothetical protein